MNRDTLLQPGDYDSMTDGQLRERLTARDISRRGKRALWIKRLRESDEKIANPPPPLPTSEPTPRPTELQHTGPRPVDILQVNPANTFLIQNNNAFNFWTPNVFGRPHSIARCFYPPIVVYLGSWFMQYWWYLTYGSEWTVKDQNVHQAKARMLFGIACAWTIYLLKRRWNQSTNEVVHYQDT